MSLAEEGIQVLAAAEAIAPERGHSERGKRAGGRHVRGVRSAFGGGHSGSGEGHSRDIRRAFKGNSNLKKGIQRKGVLTICKNIWAFDM